MCVNCDLEAEENTKHIIMECPFLSTERILMMQALNIIIPEFERHGALSSG